MTTIRGGTRAGAGRKRGIASITAEEARKYTLKRIAEELEPILLGQIELAKGIYSEVIDEDGTRTVYQKTPDPRVGAFLLNQLIGKPKETAEINITPPFSLRALSERADQLEKKQKERILEGIII